MEMVDFHCDTLSRIFDLQNHGKYEETVWKNKGEVDINRLVKAGYRAQFFACYLMQKNSPFYGSHFDDALHMAELLHNELTGHEEQAAFAGSWEDYLKNKDTGKLSCFLTVEEGGILENQIDRLDVLYDKGIRLITLSWNYENCLGYPGCIPVYREKGLKPFGIEVLERMDELGIIADVSHLSDGGFEDVYLYGKRPFLASHSNARSICPHSRNLTDEMIRKLAERGGLMGLNFYGPFLSEDGQSTMEAMLCHIRHMMNVGGREIVGIGSDFDGMGCKLEIEGCQFMQKLPETMEREGFTVGEIEDVCFRNAEKFMERYWEK